MADPAAQTNGYMPKLASALAEGYGLGELRRDTMAALTVAIVALPLSMAMMNFLLALAMAGGLAIALRRRQARTP